MKTTIYELLGMIKDNNTPKKIIFKNLVYTWYESEVEKDYESGTHWLFDEYVITDILNDEVEILETTITYKPDKIEKVNTYELYDYDFNHLDENDNWISTNIINKAFEEYSHKINEIIEVLNENN